MKKLIIILGVLTVSLTSCLKDKPNVDLSNVGAFAELVHSGIPYFASDAVTDAGTGDDLTITKTFQINITGQYAPTKDVTVTLSVDNSLIAPYNAANPLIAYQVMPTNAYSFPTTTVTIKAGTRLATATVTFKKANLDVSKSFMLPIKISAANGVPISGNYAIHYYHFIGNPFAGLYDWHFERRNNADGSGAPAGGSFDDEVTIYPVTGTQFEVTSGYYLATERYEVTFTQVDATHFKNFQVTLNAADVVSVFNNNGITVTQAPVIFVPGYDANTVYSYTDALKLFKFQYVVFNGSASRYCIDQYTKK